MLKRKPVARLIGTDGNIFSLIAKANVALQRAGQDAEAKQMTNDCLEAGSYDEALSIIGSYVEIR